MQIEILASLEQIAALKQDWDALYDKTSPGLFMHHSWVYNNYKLLNQGEILLIALYAERRQLIGIFPFAIRPIKIKMLKFNAIVHGGSAVTDYSQFIIDPDSNCRLMIKRVIKNLEKLQSDLWDFVFIENLNDGCDHSKLFMRLAARRYYAGMVASDITPTIKLGTAYAEASKISNIKRRFSKIAGECTISHLHSSHITSEHMRQFTELHKVSFPNAAFGKEGPQDFYRVLCDDTDFGDHVCLSILKRGNELIAAHFGFEDDNHFFYYVPVYNENYSSYGPGQYLLWKLITRAEERGKTTFDMLRGDEEYKHNWTNSINSNYTLFGCRSNAGFIRKLIVNLWIATRSTPFLR